MKVLLLDNIRGVGQIGDIKDAADGYARNFLLPRKLAKIAGPGAEQEAEKLKSKRVILLAEEKKQAEEIATKLKDFTLSLSEKASPAGTLFGAVTKRDLVKELRTTAHIELTEDVLLLKEPLKTVGEHVVDLNLGFEITVPLKVIITSLK